MTAEEALKRILGAFREEVHKHRGHIGDLEEQLGRYRGYLAKVASGRYPISVDQLLRILEVLGVDPAEFFGRALDLTFDAETVLAEIGGELPKDPELEEILRLGRQLGDSSGSD